MFILLACKWKLFLVYFVFLLLKYEDVSVILSMMMIYNVQNNVEERKGKVRSDRDDVIQSAEISSKLKIQTVTQDSVLHRCGIV